MLTITLAVRQLYSLESDWSTDKEIVNIPKNKNQCFPRPVSKYGEDPTYKLTSSRVVSHRKTRVANAEETTTFSMNKREDGTVIFDKTPLQH